MRSDRVERIQEMFNQIGDMGLDAYVRSRVLSEPIPTRLANRLSVAIYSESGIHLLSNRERQILTLLFAGMRRREIGIALDMGEETVKHHIKHIYAKLDVGSVPEALYQAARQGWLENL